MKSIHNIARVCHEVNRAYCQALGDNSLVEWEDSPFWQRSSVINGVKLHMSGDHGPNASHESWMAQKVEEGWVYGEVKNADEKTHPCIVPFDKLPRAQQAKDFIFRAVVHALTAENDEQEPKTVTMQGILDKIQSATYTLLPNGRTTVCQLTLENGFTVEGQSACVSADTYNRALGEKYAYEDALSNVWKFEGYLLAEKLSKV